MSKQLLTTQEAADYLGVSRYFLERDRSEGPSVPVIYVGHRSPRYRTADLERYLDARTRQVAEDPDDDHYQDWDDDDDPEDEEEYLEDDDYEVDDDLVALEGEGN